MIVLDASAALDGLDHPGAARDVLATEALHTLHLIDSEVVSALRRLVGSRRLDADAGTAMLTAWSAAGVIRYPALPLLGRVWALRAHLSAHDAGYVALAEALQCPLVTADVRLARAPGLRCPVSVVPG